MSIDALRLNSYVCLHDYVSTLFLNCFYLQHFKENKFFNDRVLKKEYKYLPPPAAESEKPDENGITDSMLDFSWDRDVQISVR